MALTPGPPGRPSQFQLPPNAHTPPVTGHMPGTYTTTPGYGTGATTPAAGAGLWGNPNAAGTWHAMGALHPLVNALRFATNTGGGTTPPVPGQPGAINWFGPPGSQPGPVGPPAHVPPTYGDPYGPPVGPPHSQILHYLNGYYQAGGGTY